MTQISSRHKLELVGRHFQKRSLVVVLFYRLLTSPRPQVKHLKIAVDSVSHGNVLSLKLTAARVVFWCAHLVF